MIPKGEVLLAHSLLPYRQGAVLTRDLIRINPPSIGREEIEAVTEVLKSGVLTDKSGMGPYVTEFERNIANYLGSKHAIALSSGTGALHGAILAAGVQPGDEVIIPSFTFAGCASAIVMAGAVPVFADIDRETYCITDETIQRVVTRKTKAIMPVHLYGLPCDLKPIYDFANERDLAVIEDASQALGSMYDGQKVGALSSLACFSLYPSKNITTGEGGVVATNQEEMGEALRMIRSHGEQRPYWIVRQGHNYHMTEIAAAIGLVQLRKLPTFLERRRTNAQSLRERLQLSGKLILPRDVDKRRHAWNLFTVRLRGVNAGKRNKIVEKLWGKNIHVAVYYQPPIHSTPFYRTRFPARKGDLLETERASRQVFSLPIHPKLTESDIEYMAEVMKKVVA